MIPRGVLTAPTKYALLTGLLVLLMLAPAGSGSGAITVSDEQRCKNLGANCLCSEPFNTNVLQRIEPSWFNPVDGVVKQCSTSIAGAPIERNNNDVFGDNDATALAALPRGNQISYFVRGPEGHLGIFYAGNSMGSQYVARGAARWYMYHSPNFQFKDEGSCTNAKLAQFDSALLDKSFGYVHMYNFLSWNPSQDCCTFGPGVDNLDTTSWKGKWWRIEVVFSNRAGGNPGFVAKVYAKNVTDNTPEIVVVDTSMPGTSLVQSSTRTPPVRQDQMWMNNYRETACTGWLGFSYYMMAGWDTDAGQRIGAAVGVEGGGDTTPPAAPKNLRITN